MIQITIRQDPVTHVDDNDEDTGGSIIKALKFWRHSFLPEDVELVELWYIGKQKFHAAKEPRHRQKDSLNVIYFEDSANGEGLPLLNLV
jgi:hypothetical protein